MKKKLIVTSLLAATVFASAANAANGTFNITGTIAATPCVASTTVSNITMPNIELKKLGAASGQTSSDSTTDITIKLSGCPAVQQNATVTFTGTADTTNPKALKLDGVEGVALALFEENGTKEIEINQAADVQVLDGSATKDLKYKAKYISTASLFKPGNATATLDFGVTFN
ncbi:fimbrial protein [Yersinia enterocolitica]|jgi:major type 1 subunit fimbrin (pilin)|uniref:Fimbrial protein n=2 Tax=Yersinia TaxID=629 RepID=A0AAI8ZS31_YERFR|nr:MULTISPECIES: fimbrial protein [Yersinia]HEI6965914.1 type 1 fimbrial protein [Yersinia enterocolitica]AVX37241.1 type 1 fimbrial protein [Yersinia massiliensis]MDN0126988.1 fimbrial protein [Yersinia massiliensis]QKJ12047.1 type 1 fimbrial protein [Yersinia massiliensis]CFR07673.1 putative fimbrial protein [Yersinia frederiksenii]